MEAHAQPAAAAVDDSGKYHFLVRRLHSLSGLVPIGAFVVVHLLTNASILAPGPAGAEFQKSVERIHALGPLLVPVEIAFIFLPLAFHALVGFWIWFEGKPNALQYRYGPNIRYTLQRWTGGIAFFFILYHVWQMHWFGKPFGGGVFEVVDESGTPLAAVKTAQALQSAWWVAPAYALGVIATVFHLANGIWTALITWGITIKPRSQRISAYACAIFGVVVALIGLGAVSGFRTFSAEEIAPAAATAVHADAAPGAGH